MYRTDFTPEIVLRAYSMGVFPMHHSDTGEILWYRPDPRTIIPLDGFHLSHSLAKTIRSGRFEVKFNTDYIGVMRGCADRPEGTWISDEFYDVYGALFMAGFGGCVEVYYEGELAGGLYGLTIGGAFMAESMFHRVTDASKVAVAALVDRLNERGFELLDVQYLTSHLASLGAVEIPGSEYEKRLAAALRRRCRFA